MKRKFKFLGHEVLDEKTGKAVTGGKNFGRYDFIQIGRVIEAKDDAEAEQLANHPEFEEVTDKKAAPVAAK
jgi:hypothetical protein